MLPHVKIRQENFGFLVLSPSSPLLSINVDGGKILQRCDGSHSLQQIMDEIAAETGDTPANVEVTVLRYVKMLRKLKVVTYK
jgi:hypothetical protein